VPGSQMRRSLIALTTLLALVGCVTPVQQIGAYPEERGVVCAVKLGMRQNYWTAQAAQLDGAVVVFAGECPAQPNSEGFAH